MPEVYASHQWHWEGRLAEIVPLLQKRTILKWSAQLSYCTTLVFFYVISDVDSHFKQFCLDCFVCQLCKLFQLRLLRFSMTTLRCNKMYT